MEHIQKLFPGWSITRVISQTEYSTVYEISREIFGKKETAALKQIVSVYSEEDIQNLRNKGYSDKAISIHYHTVLQELVKEYSLLLNMQEHPNILHCDDLKYERHSDGFGWTLYIKMELLQSAPQLFSGNYDEETVINMAMDICCALIECQKHGIVHRDIRPKHILLSQSGSYKLSNFSNATTETNPVPPSRLHSFDYLAPEVHQGLPCSVKADIYSLGMVMYSMMNLHHVPFVPLSADAPAKSVLDSAFRNRISGTPIPAPMHGSAELKAIVIKACSHAPDHRYHSPEEMYDALAQLKHHGPAPVITDPSTPLKSQPQPPISEYSNRQPAAPKKKRRPFFLIPLIIGGGCTMLAVLALVIALVVGSINSSKTYIVQFVDWNGQVLCADEYVMGDAIIEPEAPQRDSDSNSHYVFSGWDKPVGLCEGDMCFTATYQTTQKRAGWVEENGEWYYYNDDTRVALNWVQDSDGRWVYLTQDGSILKNNWAMDSQGWHFMDEDGYIATNCWQMDSSDWVYLDENGNIAKDKWIQDNIGWCHVDANGYMDRNKWIQDSIGWCHVDANGYMDRNKWIEHNMSWYYVGEDGYRMTNCWVQDSVDWVYLNENGTIATNSWIQDSVGWCYVDENGYMVRNKKVPDGDVWYDIGPDGYIQKTA